MKSILSTLICALLFNLSASAQSKTNIDTIIKSIRKEFTIINNKAHSSKYKKQELKVEGLSTEGGKIEKYYEGNKLRMAKLVLYGETGQIIYEYYFSGGKLIFCYEKNETYDKEVSEGPPFRIVRSIEERFYFHNNKLIRWLGGDQLKDKVGYPEKEKEIMISLKEDLQLM